MLYIFEQADLSKPETIPATLVGIHTIIDCATGRPEEPIKTVSFAFDFLTYFYVFPFKNQYNHLYVILLVLGPSLFVLRH